MKPIAEIVWAGGIEDSIKDVKFYETPSPDVGTLLYTRPPKELTDEEKWEVFTNLARSPDLRTDMIRFADSIIRKAQEK